MSTGTLKYYNFLDSELFERIMSYNEHELEDDHSFIQWIFPTIRRSIYNRDAPIIDISELRSHHKYEDARLKMLRSLEMMKVHWGIMGNEIFDFEKFQCLDGHNGLRLSRVLQSLIYHELVTEAYELLRLVCSNLKYLHPHYERGTLIWERRFNEAIEDAKCH